MLEELAAPSVFPVSLAVAKDWLRETTTDSDAVVTRLLKAAVARVEKVTHNFLVYRPVREQYDYFLPYFELTGFPVRGLSSIKYLDSAGVQQTWALADTVIDVTKGAARITPAYAKYFPPTRVILNSVQMYYDVGLLAPIASVDAAADSLTIPGHNKAVGDYAQFSTDGTAALPAPLVARTAYYVANVNGNDIKVSATLGGPVIDLTDTGSGGASFLGILPDDMLLAMQLMMDTWFRNRSDIGPNEVFQMPSHGGAEALLAPYMPRGFQ